MTVHIFINYFFPDIFLFINNKTLYVSVQNYEAVFLNFSYGIDPEQSAISYNLALVQKPANFTLLSYYHFFLKQMLFHKFKTFEPFLILKEL